MDAHVLQPGHVTAPWCAVGLWTDMSVRVLRLPSLEEAARDILGGGATPQPPITTTTTTHTERERETQYKGVYIRMKRRPYYDPPIAAALADP
jgi:hypothetical protein